MKTKIFGFAAILSLASLLGACGGGSGTSEPAATTSTSPAAGEPADGGAMMSPSTRPSPVPTTTP